MKPLSFIIIFFLLVVSSFGQATVKKSSLSAGGGSSTAGTTTVIHSVGGVFVQEQTAGSVHLSEGFIGPDMAVLLGVQDFTLLKGISLYPNPVQDDLYIRFRHPGEYEVYIHDLTGRKLLHKRVEKETLKTLSLAGYRPGVYIVSVVERKSRKYVSFKVEKQ